MRKIPNLLFLTTILTGACSTAHDVKASVAFGGGTMEHKTDGTNFDDKTSAGYFALGVEALFSEKVGGGIRLEGSASDDDMFADVAPLATGEASDGELFLHGTALLGAEESPLPLRFGLFFRGYGLTENVGGEELTWSSFGPRLEFAPDIELSASDDFRWSLPARLGAGIGMSVVETEPETEQWDTTMAQFDVGLATRLQFSKFWFDVGYLMRRTNYAESDDVGGVTILGADSTFSGLVFTFGATF